MELWVYIMQRLLICMLEWNHTLSTIQSISLYISVASLCTSPQLCPAPPPVWLPQDQWLCLPHSILAAWCLEETTAVPLTQNQDDRRSLDACNAQIFLNQYNTYDAFWISPAVNHELIEYSWAPRRRGKTSSFVDDLYALHVGAGFEWFVSETPYLIHDTTKAPHITGSGVFLIVEGLYQK